MLLNAFLKFHGSSELITEINQNLKGDPINIIFKNTNETIDTKYNNEKRVYSEQFGN